MGDHMDSRNGCLHWELQFSRSIQDWELESVSTFLDLLYSAKVLVRIFLYGDFSEKKKDFSVSRFYKALFPSVAVEFPWKAIWKPKPRPGWLSFFGQHVWEIF